MLGPFTMKQSQTGGTQTRGYFRLIKIADGLALTGATGTARISKNGAASAATTNNIVEIDVTNQPGMYYVELTATELNTLGHVVVTKKDAASFEGGFTAIVVPDDVFTAAATANDIADAILDRANAIETGYTVRYALRIIAAACAGKSSNSGKTYRDLADGRDVITATVDGSGNRTAVTLDPTP
jgi:hypothetical protein